MVDTQRDFCNVTATWKVTSGQEITQFVVYRREPEQENGGRVAPPGGLTLECEPPGGAPCQLLFDVQPRPTEDVNIIAVDVLCDASKAEVFTQTQGYVGITHGIRVDEDLQVEGKLFLLQHEFDQPVTKCSLQLIAMPQSNKIWIHTIYVTIETCPTMPSMPNLSMMMMGIAPTTANPSIDIAKVKTLMSGVDTNLPEGAKHLLETMETFQKNKMPFSRQTPSASAPSTSVTAGGFDQMTALMSMFQGLDTSSTIPQQKSTETPNTTESNHQPSLPSIQRTDDSTEGIQNSSNTRTVCNSDQPKPDLNETRSDESINFPAPGLSKLLTASMEAKFLEHMNKMEERISQKVSQQLSALESRILNKLDRILEVMPERLSESSSPERGRTRVTELENTKQTCDSSQDLD